MTVHLDGDILEFRGERATVSGVAREAIAHLLAAASRPRSTNPPAFGGYRLDLASCVIMEAAPARDALQLSRKECGIMDMLFSAKGRIVLIGTIYAQLYPGPEKYAGPGVIRVVVHHLRAKLVRAAVRLEIVTRRELGYGLRVPEAVAA